MQRAVSSMITLVILVFSLLVFSMPTQAEQDLDLKKLSEDIEIMSMIFDITLQGNFPSPCDWSFPFNADAGCRGIYLPGYGALFIASVSFPIIPDEGKTKPDKSTDLWKQMESMISGKKGNEFEEQFKDMSRDIEVKIMQAIGTYASNIDQLGPEDFISVVLFGTGSTQAPGGFAGSVSFSSAPFVSIVAGKTLSPAEDSTISGNPLPPAEDNGSASEQKPDMLPTGWDQFGATFAAPEQGKTLVIQVKMKAITDYKAGKMDFDAFRKQANVLWY